MPRLQLIVTLALILSACEGDLSGGPDAGLRSPIDAGSAAEAQPTPDASSDATAPPADAPPDAGGDAQSPSQDAKLSPDAEPPLDAKPPTPDTTPPKDISFPPPPPPCASTGSSCSADLVLGKGKVTYWRSYALDAPNAQVTRGVVVVHGSSLNADDYFGYVVSSAKAAGVLSSTVVVAPRFPESAGANDELYWGSEWRSGDDGSAPNGATISSFGVLDAIATKLGDPSTFPKLSTIVVTGHSAGGQFAQRYGAAGKSSPAGVVMRYVPANPSSYLYFNDHRRVNGVFVNSGSAFSACSSYDNYKYGLKNRSGWPYLASQSDSVLKGSYFSRVVVYLIGDADTCNSDLDSTCDDHGLAKSCSAMLQGDHRYERGQNYWLHINKYFAGHPHQLKVIPGVAHSGNQMFNSPGGRAALFN